MKKLLVICLTLVIAMNCSTSAKVSGNSGPTSWQGTSGAELLSIDEGTPIEVIGEHLVFDFREIMDEDYTISSWITATYDMRNTSDQMESSMMTFPMMSYNPIHGEDVLISVDGAKVVYELHPHSLNGDQKLEFSDLVSDIRKDYRRDTLFNATTEGNLLTFDLVTGSDAFQEITLDLRFDPSKTQLITEGFNSGHYNYGHVVLGADLREEDAAYVYYRGETPTMSLSDNASLSEAPMTFMTYYHGFILSKINALDRTSDTGNLSSQYNDISLFNLLAGGLQVYMDNQSSVVDLEDLAMLLQGQQIVSANYQVVFEPGQTRQVEVTYKVKASMKNRLYGDREDGVYTFEYFLSPAKSWRDFGSLTVDLYMDEAPWRLEASNQTFEAVTSGYRQIYQGLPDEDLSITLTHQDKTGNPDKTVETKAIKDWMIFLFVLAGLSAFGIMGLLVLKRKTRG